MVLSSHQKILIKNTASADGRLETLHETDAGIIVLSRHGRGLVLMIWLHIGQGGGIIIIFWVLFKEAFEWSGQRVLKIMLNTFYLGVYIAANATGQFRALIISHQ